MTTDSYSPVQLEYTYDDVLSWLKEQPSDKIVHEGPNNICKTCLVAKFLQDKLNDPSISVAFTTAESEAKHIDYRLYDWFSGAIYILDYAVDVGEMTAERAVGILENMERKS